MGGRSIRLALVLGAALALVAMAGCQVQLPEESPAGTQSTPASVVGSNITVQNGSFAADPDLVFQRLRDLRESDGPPPATIRLRNFSELANNDTGPIVTQFNPTPFWDHLNLTSAEVDVFDEVDLLFQGSVSGAGVVTIYLDERASAETEHLVLAHELTHYVQVQSGQFTDLVGALDMTTTDGVYVRRALMEGDAVFTTDAYLETDDVTDQRNAPLYDRIGAVYPPGDANRFRNSQYVVGHEYVASQVADPAAVEDLYADPPTTSEQLLHELPPGSEPPVALSIDRTTGEAWRYVGDDRMGEAFTRHALASELGMDRAATAAAGWGNDSLQIFRPTDGGEPSYAWVLRWDDEANATEFEAAAADAFDSIGSEAGEYWRLTPSDGVAAIDRPTPQTVVLLLGAEAFVTNTTVAGEDATVSLRTGSDSSPAGSHHSPTG
jgi:hypothetical protein